MELKSKSSENIGIVGLGLIGGSLGIDLQRMGHSVYGLVHRESTAQRAKERGLAQIISTNPNILRHCSVIILALPLAELLNPSPILVEALPLDAVITDVGSVKNPILNTWKQLHPYFVASHPMAGTHQSGVEAGVKDLFKGKPWIATPEEKTNPKAIETIKQLAISIGAQWITAKADIHDQAVALISHLPVLISANLLKIIAEEKDPKTLRLAKSLASTGFSDTTRIGGGNPDLGLSIMKSNTQSILELIKLYKSSLEELESKIILKEWEALKEELENSKEIRKNFLNKQV